MSGGLQIECEWIGKKCRGGGGMGKRVGEGGKLGRIGTFFD